MKYSKQTGNGFSLRLEMTSKQHSFNFLTYYTAHKDFLLKVNTEDLDSQSQVAFVPRDDSKPQNGLG